VLDGAALELAEGRVVVPPRVIVEDHATLSDAIDNLKRQRIAAAVERCDGNWAEAARRLGLDRGNLHRMAKRLGMHT